MFHQKSSNSTYRNIGWKKVVLCCSVSGLALFAAETAEASCETTGTMVSTSCNVDAAIQYWAGDGATSLTIANETANVIAFGPHPSTTEATTQTLIIKNGTTITNADYSAVHSSTVDQVTAKRDITVNIESGVSLNSSGTIAPGFGGVFIKNNSTGDISITSGAIINSTKQNSGAAGLYGVTTGGNVYITNEASGNITSDDRGIYADGGSKTIKTAPYTVSITNHGTVNANSYTTGKTGFGARVNNYYGNAAITNTGTITAKERQGVVTWSADGGSSSINNSGKIEAGDDIAVQAWSTNGDAIVTNSGKVTSSDDTGHDDSGSGHIGIQTQVATSGNTTITNTASGTVTASADTGIEAKALTAGNITISNAGTVSSLRGIYAETASGTINISNSGTISATQYAIKTTGTTQSLVNSGTIKGNIENTSATGLTISNDNSTIYGVLSGYTSDSSMVKGQITHTNADLTFSSGKIWLNDDINATGHSVKNTGATLKLSNAVTITGNYVQTGGGLLVEATNTSSHGALNVSGDAAISNSTVVVSGNNLAVGDSYTIVGAGGTGSYTTLSASVVGTADRNAVVKTVGKDLVVILTKADGTGKYTPVGNAEGGSATPLGRTLDTINAKDTPAAIAFQNQVLAQIDSLPEAQRGTAIKELSPASAANTVQLSAQATSIVIGAVETRQQIAMSGDGASQTGIAAGDEARYSQLWGQILGGSAHRAGDSENDGFTSKSFGLTSGFDHLITPNLLGGVALSWVRSWTDGSNASNGSTNTLDSYQMTFYGTYHIDRLAIDGQIGAGWNHYDQQRTISFLGNTASADYDGQQYMARTRVGYDFSLGDTTLTPFAGLRWLGARTESYQETGAGAANNSVNSQNNSSVTHEVGARAEWSFDTPTGIVSPEVSAAWIHDYTDNTVDTTGQIGGTDYSIQTKGLESDGVRLGIGLSYQTYENLSLKLSYDGELRSGYQSQAATLRMNLDF
jgi:outer membrane autotransporter protein